MTLGNSDHPCARLGNGQCTLVRCLHVTERNEWVKRYSHLCSSGYKCTDGGQTNSLKRYSKCILLIPETHNTGYGAFSHVSLRKNAAWKDNDNRCINNIDMVQ